MREILECDLKIEKIAHPLYKDAIAYCEEVGDYVSRALFVEILDSEEEHIDFLETQLGLIDRMGEHNYVQTQVGQDPNQTPDPAM